MGLFGLGKQHLVPMASEELDCYEEALFIAKGDPSFPQSLVPKFVKIQEKLAWRKSLSTSELNDAIKLMQTYQQWALMNKKVFMKVEHDKVSYINGMLVAATPGFSFGRGESAESMDISWFKDTDKYNHKMIVIRNILEKMEAAK